MVELLEVIAVSVSVSLITALVIFLLMRGNIAVLKSTLNHEIPQIRNRLEEIGRYSEGGKLKEEFQAFGQDIVSRIDSLKRLSTEELSKVREDITTLAERRSVDAAINHVKQVTITREEFERLRETVVKMGGREEAAERLEALSEIFESTEIRVLAWQCKLIHLLEGGLAPEAEADVILSAGIPAGSSKEFLRKLQALRIAVAKKVESFWLNPDFTWLVAYTQDPDWLKHQLEDKVKKEHEYEEFLRDDSRLIEEGLVVVTEQFELPSGRVDIFARDSKGKDVLVELKYPVATTEVLGQLLKYREDQQHRTGDIPRCILVAPRIPDKTKKLVEQNGMEWREILF